MGVNTRQGEAERQGRSELRAAVLESGGRRLLTATAVFSVFANLLMLTGPLFMLQVYDRVLGSRSEETLAALFLLVVFLFSIMGALDIARGRLMARIGARMQNRLDPRIFRAMVARDSLHPGDPLAASAGRDLDAVQRLVGSPVLLALFDMPFAPLFLLAVFVFHPLLGFTALAGGTVLVIATLFNQAMTRRAVLAAAQAGAGADRLADQIRDEADLVRGLGMQGAAFDRWQGRRQAALLDTLRSGDTGGAFTVFSRVFRMFLQSAMLAVGAWLVLREALTPGAMIASSILMGRALAPVEQAIGGWSVVQRAQEGWRRLGLLLGAEPAPPLRTRLPRPEARLEVNQLVLVPPGQTLPAVRGLSFALAPGQALGIIGPSGAGKSTLARALVGSWRPAAGSIRLDGATLDQYDGDQLGACIGYLPQRVTLFDGTIAENIARLAGAPDPDAVVAAARAAGAHDMILRLPEGYETRVTQAASRLSGGQMQRLGLARALYGDPVLLVLDEPNSNLDSEGSAALNTAIHASKAAGRAVLIMAHRPAAIQECDLLLVLEDGQRRAFGPRDEVLRAAVRNAPDIVRATGRGSLT